MAPPIRIEESERCVMTRASRSHATPVMKAYDGLTNLTDDLHWYIAQIEIARANNPIMCKAFSSKLKRAASTWFGTLQGKKYSDFKALAMAFLRHFMWS